MRCGSEYIRTYRIQAGRTAPRRIEELKSGAVFALKMDSQYAGVVEMVDALDLGSSGVTRASSSLAARTMREIPVRIWSVGCAPAVGRTKRKPPSLWTQARPLCSISNKKGLTM